MCFTSGLAMAQDPARDSSGLGRTERQEKSDAGGEIGFGLGNISCWLDSRMDEFLGRLCKTLTTGGLFLALVLPLF